MAEDPVVVDAKHYTVDFENEHIRVLRIRYGPREKSVMHGHPSGVGVFLTDSVSKFTMPDGTTEEIQGKAGETFWLPAQDHLPENLTDQSFEVIFVELKGR